MAEGAALLVDEVLPREPMRQWVLSVPCALRYLFATAPAVMGQVLGILSPRNSADWRGDLDPTLRECAQLIEAAIMPPVYK